MLTRLTALDRRLARLEKRPAPPPPGPAPAAWCAAVLPVRARVALRRRLHLG